MKTYYSPLRYPGGKGVITPLLAELLVANNLENCSYVEPYAGGAGSAISLLIKGYVNEIHLNDADPLIYAFWHCVLNDSEKFIDKIIDINVTMDEWYKQKKIISNYDKHNSFDIGFATFFLNRCNRSGIIKNAGPIGGLNQSGKWKINARFNKENLIQRVKRIALYSKNIYLYNLDAIEFLKKLPKNRKKKKFVYLDPPYFKNGKNLYLNFYNSDDHIKLSKYLLKSVKYSWILTYDNTQEIVKLYNKENMRIKNLKINYSLQEKRIAKEIIIFRNTLFIPNTDIINKYLFKYSA